MNEKTINNWVAIAEYDIQTTKAMLESGRYLYVAYTSQQRIEKILKAFYVYTKNQTPPYIYNLFRLVELTGLIDELNEKQKDFIIELNSYYIESRYTDDLAELSKQTNRAKATELYFQTLEIFK